MAQKLYPVYEKNVYLISMFWCWINSLIIQFGIVPGTVSKRKTLLLIITWNTCETTATNSSVLLEKVKQIVQRQLKGKKPLQGLFHANCGEEIFHQRQVQELPTYLLSVTVVTTYRLNFTAISSSFLKSYGIRITIYHMLKIENVTKLRVSREPIKQRNLCNLNIECSK